VGSVQPTQLSRTLSCRVAFARLAIPITGAIGRAALRIKNESVRPGVDRYSMLHVCRK
jgi:hypothetical protein